MILVAFVCFAVLVAAWLIAPTGTPVAKTEPAPATLKTSEAGA
jgi:hypothetical protein